MAISVRDDLNQVITLSALARRIVSLSPAATENLFAVGAGGFVVGVTSADTYPPAVKRLQSVGDFGLPRYETLAALRPDLLVAESGTLSAAVVAHLAERTGVPVFGQVSRAYRDVARHLTQLCALAGIAHGADEGSAELRRAETIAGKARAATAGKKPVTVFFEVSRSPLYAAGPGSFMDYLIRIAGGVNVVQTREPYPLVSRERLIVSDPDVYLTTFAGAAPHIARGEPLPPPLDRLRAARTGRVIALPGDLVQRPTPRLAAGLLLLVRALHGATPVG